MGYEQLQLILDTAQTIGLVVICGVLIYFVIRLERNVRTAAELMRSVTEGQADIQKRLAAIEEERFNALREVATSQKEFERRFERLWVRIDAIEVRLGALDGRPNDDGAL